MFDYINELKATDKKITEKMWTLGTSYRILKKDF